MKKEASNNILAVLAIVALVFSVISVVAQFTADDAAPAQEETVGQSSTSGKVTLTVLPNEDGGEEQPQSENDDNEPQQEQQGGGGAQ